jgi:cyclase
MIADAKRRVGSQCIVASIDAKRRGEDRWEVYTHGGTRATGIDALEWAERCELLGAGEILVTSIDCDGGREGYDVALTRAVAERVSVPVIASGGAGCADHVVRVLAEAGADAALIAGILHDSETSIAHIKQAMEGRGLPVRWGARV